MKRLKYIEAKNEQQLEAIKDQGEKQLNVIEKQDKNKLETIESEEKIVYLRKRLDQLFKTCPESFDNQSKILLERLAKNENKISYGDLPHKILFSDARFPEINFLKKYGTLYSLLKDLVTKKMTVNNANADQISFIINLMHGYKEEHMFDKEVTNDFKKG